MAHTLKEAVGQTVGFRVRLESKVGRAMMMQQILQYVGNSLSKDDIGRMIRTMPYFNAEEAYSDLTIAYDNATNDILALDRGDLSRRVHGLVFLLADV